MRNTFEHKGRTFKIEFPYDDSSDAPWDRDCGHGPVSDWKRHPFGQGTKPPKAPGERILNWDRGSYRTYDFAEAMRIAKRDGWGLGEKDKAALAAKLGREPTKGEITAEAVERDFEFLRAWCNDEWQYVGVVVTHPDSGESESLWGIESCATEYLEEVAHELASEITNRLDTAMAAEIEASRPDMVFTEAH